MDLHTVRVEHVVLLTLCSVLTLANWRINRGTRGMHWFAGYIFCLVAGAILMALRGQIPDLYSFMLGNLLFMGAYFLLYLAVSEVIGRSKMQLYLQVAFVVVAAMALLQYEVMHTDTKSRTVAFSLVLAIEEAQIAFLLYHRKDALLRAAGAPMAYMMAGLSLTNSIRVGGVFLHGALAARFATNAFMAGIVATSSALQCGTVVAYVWLTASLLRRDLEIQATTDPLTGLLNRRAIENLALNTLGLEKQTHGYASLLLMDLDGFKLINDTLGHGCGDETLMTVAKCLRGTVRHSDLVARLGGDEFAILLPSTPLKIAFDIAEQLRLSIAMLEVPWGSRSARVTTSIGLSQSHSSLSDWNRLVVSCDHAMYAAKKTGGNRVVYEAGASLEDALLP